MTGQLWGRRANRKRSSRPRPKSAGGFTLVEVLMSMALIAMVMLPLMAWAVTAMQQQSTVSDRLERTRSTAKFKTYLARDIANAATGDTPGLPADDCTGGTSSGGDMRLVLDSPIRLESGEWRATRVVYVEAPMTLEDGSTSATEISLWRRTCPLVGQAGAQVIGAVNSEIEVVIGLRQPSGSDAVTVSCTPTVGNSDACRTVEVQVAIDTEKGPDTIGLAANRRIDPGVLGGGVAGPPLSGNYSPTAVITHSGVSGYQPLTVDFSAASSTDPDGTIVEWHWDFGDNTSASTEQATKTYSGVGSYNAILTVTDNKGATSTTYVPVVVQNRPPTAVASYSPTPTKRGGNTTTFNGTGSSDLDGTIVEYAWLHAGDQIGSGATLNYQFPNSVNTGTTTVTLRVTDNDGGVATTNLSVQIDNILPTIGTIATDPSGSTLGTAPMYVTFSVPSASDSDGSIASYAWNFGDGTISNQASPTHHYANSGSFTVNVTITDNNGGTKSTSKTIRLNGAPTASFTYSPTTGNAPRSTTFTSTSTDGDGSITSWAWNFGQFGGTANGSSSTRTLYGGNHSVTLTVTDNDGSTASTNQIVRIPGSPAPPTGFHQTDRAGGGGWSEYAWNGQPGVTGYQLHYQRKSGWFCSDGYGNDKYHEVEPGTSTSTRFNEDVTVCGERVRMRPYSVVSGTRYYGNWTTDTGGSGWIQW